MRVLKFGGKSLSTLKKTQKICKYIEKIYKNDKKLIIIVSATGNTTDNLIKLSKDLSPEKSKRELDNLLSTGEAQSASIFAMALNSIGVPAKSFLGWQIKINTCGAHQNSVITHINKKKLEKCLESNIVAVVAGFQGVNKNGDITTLGRGGSDTTALAIAATFGVDAELYSDFDGMFSIDPRIAKSNKLKSISYKQLERVTKNGTKIVSNRAAKIANKTNTNIILKSSKNPTLGGSIVQPLETNNILLSTKSNLCEITIDFPNAEKVKVYGKKVIFWLNSFKIYNFTIKNENIIFLTDENNKQKIIEILTGKLNL